MKNISKIIIPLISLILIISCGAYGFSGVNVGEAKTVQINYFPNQAPLVEPSLSNRFTQELQDLFVQQTNLELTDKNADLIFEGEITDYRINPMSATAEQTAAQNRLTISVNVRFTNRLEEKDSFEKQFSFYSDFPANSQLVGGVLDAALEEILERITQDIFNASVAKW